MAGNNDALGEIEILELEDERSLTDLDRATLLRQQQLMDVQLQFAATLRADLDALRALLRTDPPPARPTNGNGHGKAHMPETMSSGDQT